MSTIDSLLSQTAFEDADAIDESYRSVSRLAVTALVIAIIGLLGYWISALLVLSVVAWICGWVALGTIRRFNGELIGRPVAYAAVGIGVVSLATAIPWHYYEYKTEVPPGYERLEFSVLKSGYNQPDQPPAEALALDGQRVFIKGYIFPKSISSRLAKTFVLVPDLSSCCFGSQPPLTHMVQVHMTGDLAAQYAWRRFKLAGTLHVAPELQAVDGVTGVYYQLEADYIK